MDGMLREALEKWAEDWETYNWGALADQSWGRDVAGRLRAAIRNHPSPQWDALEQQKRDYEHHIRLLNEQLNKEKCNHGG